MAKFRLSLFLFALLLSLLVSCSTEATSERGRVEFSTKEMRLSDAKFGTDNVVHFTIYNRGEGNLTIKKVQTGCSCSKPKIEKREIPPNDSSVVTVVYRPKILGPDMQNISVYTSAAEEPYELFLRAKVRE